MKVPVSGKVFDHREIDNAIAAARDGWWTEGRFAKQFEKDFGKYLDVRYVSLVNSGSSANLLALSALTSRVFGKRAIMLGDEVITLAASFPTTVNPILQNRCTAVLIDSDVGTRNAAVSQIKKAITKKTKAIMMAHTLGNPFDLSAVRAFCDKHKLWLIEDNCDALGSRYQLGGEWVFTGTVGERSFAPVGTVFTFVDALEPAPAIEDIAPPTLSAPEPAAASLPAPGALPTDPRTP